MSWEFLDALGDSVVGAIPTVLDNVTQKSSVQSTSVAAEPLEDQTPVFGDAYLSEDKEVSFIKDNWEKLALGGLVLISVFAYMAKK